MKRVWRARPIAMICLIVALSPPLLSAKEKTQAENISTGSVSVSNAWIKSGDDSAIMFSGFAVFKSTANERWILRSISARHFRISMIHRTVIQGGEPRMVLQGSLSIRAGETVTMNNQGYHLMFVGPRKKLKAGDVVKVKLQFENKEILKVNFPVRNKAPK